MGVVGGAISRQPILGAGLALLTALVATAGALMPLAQGRRRRAFIVLVDHVLREREEWKAETGSGMPRTRSGMVSWLERHPSPVQRASLMLALGRLDEANAVLDGFAPANARDAFEVESLRQTGRIIRGESVDVDQLERFRGQIEEPRARLDRVQCRAQLEALVAVDHGNDPLDALAAAWEEDRDHAWSRRPTRLLFWPIVGLVLGIPAAAYGLTLLLRGGA